MAPYNDNLPLNLEVLGKLLPAALVREAPELLRTYIWTEPGAALNAKEQAQRGDSIYLTYPLEVPPAAVLKTDDAIPRSPAKQRKVLVQRRGKIGRGIELRPTDRESNELQWEVFVKPLTEAIDFTTDEVVRNMYIEYPRTLALKDPGAGIASADLTALGVTVDELWPGKTTTVLLDAEARETILGLDRMQNVLYLPGSNVLATGDLPGLLAGIQRWVKHRFRMRHTNGTLTSGTVQTTVPAGGNKLSIVAGAAETVNYGDIFTIGSRQYTVVADHDLLGPAYYGNRTPTTLPAGGYAGLPVPTESGGAIANVSFAPNFEESYPATTPLLRPPGTGTGGQSYPFQLVFAPAWCGGVFYGMDPVDPLNGVLGASVDGSTSVTIERGYVLDTQRQELQVSLSFAAAPIERGQALRWITGEAV
jgi:hypothetical protein